MCQFVYCNVSEYPGNVFLGEKYVLSGKCHSRKRLVRESSVRESACLGNNHLSWKLCFCLGNVCLGKCLSGKRLVRETSVQESACPGNDRLPIFSHWGLVTCIGLYHCLWQYTCSLCMFAVWVGCWAVSRRCSSSDKSNSAWCWFCVRSTCQGVAKIILTAETVSQDSRFSGK